ncbi:unnamed protein product [Gemmataceae bacterium]|jgi:DNA-directed RNA polymerase subunit RPC12/RpoP|nr:unnamed protein product [Gemmataceae bacterium]VTU02237.1 unnamed protein product [Gemmataceae bacterium]
MEDDYFVPVCGFCGSGLNLLTAERVVRVEGGVECPHCVRTILVTPERIALAEQVRNLQPGVLWGEPERSETILPGGNLRVTNRYTAQTESGETFAVIEELEAGVTRRRMG